MADARADGSALLCPTLPHRVRNSPMSSITSASSTAEITAAYLDNCGYLEDDSAAMAARFVTACTAMLARGITRSESPEGGHLEFDPVVLRQLAADARTFVGSKSTSRVTHSSFREFRS